ncbi:hypothetical protein [Oerskovia flava]|uniref:hypothetical protein n=1 Tax=Oerskovia flava TaxID=2986422 RepID=UPI00223EF2B7|nr:hypothetical protein [Oerskovia sp. JB1-3-2]
MRSARTVRTVATLSVLTLGLFGIGACSTGTEPSGSGTTGSTDEEAAGEESSDEELTPENFAQRIVDAQVAAGSVTMSMVMEAEGMTMEMLGDLVIHESTMDMAMTMTIPGSDEMEIRVVDEMFYVNMGELSGGLFVQVDPSDPEDPLAQSFDGLTEQMDPNQSIRDLDGAIKSVEKAGDPVDIDGVPSQPYDVVVDVAKVSGMMEEQAAGAELPEEITYQYWIDADDLMRKVTFDVAGSTSEMTMSNWGEDLDVVAPSADEITTEPLF